MLLGMVTHFIEGEEEAEEGIEKEEKWWVKDLVRETQPKGLEEAQLKDLLEGEMVEDFIHKVPWRGMRGIVK